MLPIPIVEFKFSKKDDLFEEREISDWDIQQLQGEISYLLEEDRTLLGVEQ